MKAMQSDTTRNEEIVEEEDCIDMDISSASFLCYTVSSPPHAGEFEFQFQRSSYPPMREATTSPADELFHKGKLLPLHSLPLLQKPFANSTAVPCGEDVNLSDKMGIKSTTKDTAVTSPFEPSTVSPVISYCASGELNKEEYCYECSLTLIHSNPKKSWFKKFNLMRESSLSHKVKVSRAYLKSLFTKSGRSEDPTAVPKDKDISTCFHKLEERNPFKQIQIESHQVAETITVASMWNTTPQEVTRDECSHRSYFSGINKWQSRTKCLSTSSSCSSSSSLSSNGLGVVEWLRRSSSVDSVEESSIEGAIAHCKMSQQPVGITKSVSDIGLYSSTASRIVPGREN